VQTGRSARAAALDERGAGALQGAIAGVDGPCSLAAHVREALGKIMVPRATSGVSPHELVLTRLRWVVLMHQAPGRGKGVGCLARAESARSVERLLLSAPARLRDLCLSLAGSRGSVRGDRLNYRGLR
jgi:hypothetical protein